MIKTTLVAIALATVAALAPMTSTAAHAASAPAPTRQVHEVTDPAPWPTVTITKLINLKHGRAYVKLSNGAAFNMRPCRYEDGKRCYWNAAKAGNGLGTSFVRLHNTTMYWTRADFRAQLAAQGWVRTHSVWGHKTCMILIGDTSYLKCYDGYRTTS